MRKLITLAVGLAIGASAIAATPALADPYPGDHNMREMRQDNRDERHDRNWQHDRRDERGMREWRHERHDNRSARDWRRGDRFDRAEWHRYQVVDYRRHHLRAPPRGYQWRQVDDRYILAAIASGVIADVIIGHR